MRAESLRSLIQAEHGIDIKKLDKMIPLSTVKDKSGLNKLTSLY